MKYKTVSALLRDKKRWVQCTEAKDADGHRAYSQDKAAVCWCLSGACLAVYGFTQKRIDAMQKLLAVIGTKSRPEDRMAWLMIWNDAPGREHKDVLAACRKAGV